MDIICKNNINKDIFHLSNFYFNKINLLNDFPTINYNGIIFPRIPLNSKGYNSISGLLFGCMDNNINLKEEDINEKDTEGKDIEISITENDNYNDETNFIHFSNYIYVHNSYFLLNKTKKKEINNINNQLNFTKNCTNKEAQNFWPLPPINIIKIIVGDKILNKNINVNSIINNIIINNIHLLLNYNHKKDISSSTIINRINNIQIFNLNLNSSSFNQSPNNEIGPLKAKFKIFPKPLNESKIKKIIRKRGRKRKNEDNNNYRIHTAGDEDNLLRKIQVHFLSFLINFVNDVIKTFINSKNPPLFKNLDYKIKKTIRRSFLNDLKSKKISEILQLRVSPKMKLHDENVNKVIYTKICNICPFMGEFLEENYLNLFKEYFYNKNRIFIVNGNTINISLKTQTFNDLIMKNNKHKEKLKNVAIRNYINIKKGKEKIKTQIFNVN